MVVTAGWLIFGIFAIAAAAFFTVFIGRRVFDPEGLVKAVREHMKAQQGAMADPDVRRAGMRWPVVFISAFWCVALYTWPRTIDFLMRGESNVITGGPTSHWANLATGYLGFGIILCAVLGLALNYFNQPKALVHPYFRGDPGLLRARRLRAEGVDVDALYEASAERWRERRARRRGRGGAPG